MNDYTRNFCLSEFNRLLPMVRETIKKERKIAKLQNEYSVKNATCEKLHESLHNIDALTASISTLSIIPDSVLKDINALQKQLVDKNSELEESITLLQHMIANLSNEWKIEIDLYRAITKFIRSYLHAVENKPFGFIRSQDIQDEYLEEYFYILSLYVTFEPSFTFESLCFDKTCQLAFLCKIQKKYSRNLAMQLKSLINNYEFKRNVFFELFP